MESAVFLDIFNKDAHPFGDVISGQNYLGLSPSYFFNALGDSISSINQYQPTTLPSYAASVQWLPNTVYITNNVVVNNGLYYRCATGGTSAGSGGPTGVATSVSDNTVTWAYMMPKAIKSCRDYLMWVEAFSLGLMQFDMNTGYSGSNYGAIKVIVTNGGSGYTSAPTVTSPGSGMSFTATVSGEKVTGVTITNPGYLVGTSAQITFSGGGGSGAAATLVAFGSGTFAGSGWQTKDMVAAIPDIVASKAQIIVVHGGTNDITNNIAYSTIISNLKICYEGLIAGGKNVIAMAILPRDTSLTTVNQRKTLKRVNAWIRAYVRSQAYANPSYARIALVDVTRYFADGTSTTGSPIGGAGSAAGAMTIDGLHPSPRGAQYIALEIIKAASIWTGNVADTSSRVADMDDGYQVSYAPAGNILEGYPWQASTAYVIGDKVINDSGKVYVCDQAGTSASSGGPTGIGSNIADGTSRWDYWNPQGLSVFAQTFGVTPSVATGVVYTGSAPDGWVFGRSGGTASGTVTISKETPWSDGQIGQRASFAFSLGSGSNVEQWQIYINKFGASALGIESAALGVDSFYVEAEIQLSSVANLTQLIWQFGDNFANNGTFETTWGLNATQGSGTNYGLMTTSGEMLSYPNNGTILMRSQPIVIPTNATTPVLILRPCFNASGGAGSATATIKINYIALRKAYTS
jgi:lysophospholipase L1-like esterase